MGFRFQLNALFSPRRRHHGGLTTGQTMVARIWPVAEAFMASILLDHLMMHVGYQNMWRK